MTSTNTFQGMDEGSKPSSRVLAPPGGGSSNIFDVDPPARQPPRSKPVERQENILGQPQPQPNQAGTGRNIRAAPKQGENSFSNIFGSTSRSSNETDIRMAKSENSTPSSASSNSSRKKQDTFKNVYGDPDFKAELNTPKSHHKNNDSFSRVFAGETFTPTPIKPYKGIESLSLSDCTPETRSESTKASSSHGASGSSFSRVFGEFQGDSKPSRLKQFSDLSEFNPITGEPYAPKTTKADSNGSGDKQTQEADDSEDQAASIKEEQASGNNNQNSKPAAADEPKERPSTRVLNPPGGRSSTKLCGVRRKVNSLGPEEVFILSEVQFNHFGQNQGKQQENAE